MALLPPYWKRARIIAQGIVNPQVAAFKSQIQQQQEQAQRESEAAFNVGQAIANQTHDAYAQAARDQMSFADPLQGSIGEMARASAADANAKIAAAGAPGAAANPWTPDAIGSLAYVTSYAPGKGLDKAAAAQQGALDYAATLSRDRALHAYDPQIATLTAQKLAAQGTLGAETEKAWLSLRDDARQQAALAIQKQTAQRAWAQELDNRALNLTNMTGSLWKVVNGRVVNTGRPAGGSTAASNYIRQQGYQASADAAAARLREQMAHNRVMEGIANSRIGISQQQANTASAREAAYEKWLASKSARKSGGIPGMSNADVRAYSKLAGDAAYTFFYGKKNSAWDSSKGGGPGKPPVVGNPYYKTAPTSAADAMTYMINHGVPYSIAFRAIYNYATAKNSHWSDALRWNPKYQPPVKRNRGPVRPGPGA